jgi:hypothetical protein
MTPRCLVPFTDLLEDFGVTPDGSTDEFRIFDPNDRFDRYVDDDLTVDDCWADPEVVR